MNTPKKIMYPYEFGGVPVRIHPTQIDHSWSHRDILKVLVQPKHLGVANNLTLINYVEFAYLLKKRGLDEETLRATAWDWTLSSTSYVGNKHMIRPDKVVAMELGRIGLKLEDVLIAEDDGYQPDKKRKRASPGTHPPKLVKIPRIPSNGMMLHNPIGDPSKRETWVKIQLDFLNIHKKLDAIGIGIQRYYKLQCTQGLPGCSVDEYVKYLTYMGLSIGLRGREYVITNVADALSMYINLYGQYRDHFKTGAIDWRSKPWYNPNIGRTTADIVAVSTDVTEVVTD